MKLSLSGPLINPTMQSTPGLFWSLTSSCNGSIQSSNYYTNKIWAAAIDWLLTMAIRYLNAISIPILRRWRIYYVILKRDVMSNMNCYWWIWQLLSIAYTLCMECEWSLFETISRKDNNVIPTDAVYIYYSTDQYGLILVPWTYMMKWNIVCFPEWLTERQS